MLLKILLLLVGVFSASTSVIWIKANTIHPIFLASFRLLIASIILTPLFIRDLKRIGLHQLKQVFFSALIPGITLGVHFIAWIFGARMTASANASLMVNMVPVAMPFIIYIMARERITPLEGLATALAMFGVFLLTVSDFHIGKETFAGDIICFISMLLFATYLALGRKFNTGKGLWTYVVPLYYSGGVFCFCVGLFFEDPIQSYSSMDIITALGLGIVPTIVGHSIFNHSMKQLRSQIVSLVNLSQFIFAGIMGYIFFREIPRDHFFTAAVLIIGGCALAIFVPQIRKRYHQKTPPP